MALLAIVWCIWAPMVETKLATGVTPSIARMRPSFRDSDDAKEVCSAALSTRDLLELLRHQESQERTTGGSVRMVASVRGA